MVFATGKADISGSSACSCRKSLNRCWERYSSPPWQSCEKIKYWVGPATARCPRMKMATPLSAMSSWISRRARSCSCCCLRCVACKRRIRSSSSRCCCSWAARCAAAAYLDSQSGHGAPLYSMNGHGYGGPEQIGGASILRCCITPPLIATEMLNLVLRAHLESPATGAPHRSACARLPPP